MVGSHFGTILSIKDHLDHQFHRSLQCIPHFFTRTNPFFQRGLSYHHILSAGHAVPYDQPAAAFAFVRDFVVGDAGYR